MCQV